MTTTLQTVSKKMLGEIGEDIPPCEFTDINPLCTSANIIENKISYFGVPVSDICLAKYKSLGKYQRKIFIVIKIRR